MTSNDLQALEPTETAGDDRAQDEGKEAAELAENQSQSSRDGQDSAIEPDKGTATNYLRGWRLLVTTVALGCVVFQVTLEVSIVATSLISIADAFDSLSRSSWFVTAYLLTYTGFLIIWAKTSDIFGRKSLTIISTLLFVAFSGACAAAQTVTQLIVFRALQGIAGSGAYSLVVVIFFELVPPARFPAYTSLISGIIAVAFLAGPLLGGAVSEYTTWRWIFLLNVPPGAVICVILAFALPRNFPRHHLPITTYKPLTWRETFSRPQLRKIDWVGTGLLLGATAFFITVLEEGGIQFSWSSPLIIAFLVLTVVLWITVFAWSWYATRRDGPCEPVLPWRLLHNRKRVGMLLSIFLTGAPFTIAIIQIPLRFQVVNGLSPLEAGLRLLPYAVLNPIGSVLAPFAAKRFKIPPLYLILLGCVLQIIGTALLSIATTSPGNVPAPYYAYEAISGLGTGINLASLIVMTPFTVEKRDKAVAMSAMVQFRTLGGAVGLALVTAGFNGMVYNSLRQFLQPAQAKQLLQSTSELSSLSYSQATMARAVFAEGYDIQMKIATGFCVAQLPAALLLWSKSQLKVG